MAMTWRVVHGDRAAGAAHAAAAPLRARAAPRRRRKGLAFRNWVNAFNELMFWAACRHKIVAGAGPAGPLCSPVPSPHA